MIEPADHVHDILDPLGDFGFNLLRAGSGENQAANDVQGKFR